MKHVQIALAIHLSLLAATGSLGAQTYDLRGPALKQGTIVQSRSEVSMPEGTLTVDAEGSLTRTPIVQKSAATSELEVVQTVDDKLTVLRYRLAESWVETSVRRDGEAPQEVVEDEPLVGEAVLIERQVDGWSKTLLGHEPHERQKPWLREPFVDPAERYPATPIAVGESWELTGPQLALHSGFGLALAAEGKATFTLEQVVESAGERHALISYRMELSLKTLDRSNNPMQIRVGGSGKVRRSLASYLDVSDRFTGQLYQEGSEMNGDRKVGVTVAGTVEGSVSQQTITNVARAEVVRRAPVTPSAQPTAPVAARNAVPPAAPPRVESKPAERSCKGVALACSQRNQFNCNLGTGCTDHGYCSGVAYESCLGKAQFACNLTPGCFWQGWSNSCGGFVSCAGKSSFQCPMIGGCFWQPSCQGTATPCSGLSKRKCSWQPGCSFE